MRLAIGSAPRPVCGQVRSPRHVQASKPSSRTASVTTTVRKLTSMFLHPEVSVVACGGMFETERVKLRRAFESVEAFEAMPMAYGNSSPDGFSGMEEPLWMVHECPEGGRDALPLLYTKRMWELTIEIVC